MYSPVYIRVWKYEKYKWTQFQHIVNMTNQVTTIEIVMKANKLLK